MNLFSKLSKIIQADLIYMKLKILIQNEKKKKRKKFAALIVYKFNQYLFPS
jgi:hypothetical protein